MRILSMIATFGKLDGDTLCLEPGLNVIHAPNEWGKSTWCAFLAAMLYGVETRERNTKGQLADKEKYAPWSGKPMEGILRIEHEGRDITIQRRAKGRVPLGEFQAYETRTGLAVPELTAENCGRVLLGVEKSVFLRTGFIRFTDLTVVPDEALWQRLHALVTTGDESGSAALLGKKLKELKNKCRSSRGGLIPEAERNLQELRTQLQEREALEERVGQLERQADRMRRETEALERHSRVCLYRQAQENREQTKAAMDAARSARDAQEKLEDKCRDVPPRSTLVSELNRAQSLLEELRQIPQEEPLPTTGIICCGILAVLALVLTALFVFLQKWIPAAAAGSCALILGLVTGKMADRRRSRMLRMRLEQSKREKQTGALLDKVNRLQIQLTLRQELETARRTTEQTRIRLQSLVSMAKQAAEAEENDDLELTLEETEARMADLSGQMRTNQLRLGQCQGRMEALADSQTLRSGIHAGTERLRELERYERALEQGLEKLEEASKVLRRRFAPRITDLTRDYLSRLTGGRYNRVSIGEDLSILAANESETTLRASQWRSDGTADQMYLALRLAVWVTLNPQGPLVLDDALVRLDDRRLEHAVALLRELGQTRQIILFSCQNREKRLVEQ